MTRWVVRATLAGALWLVGSCHTVDSTACGSGEEFAEAYAAAICDNIEPCCNTAGIRFDAMQCKKNMAGGLAFEVLDAERLGVPYDCKAGADCVADLTRFVKTCHPLPDRLSGDIEACGRIFVGSTLPGGACDVEDQCRPQPGASRGCGALDPNTTGPRVCQLHFENVGEHEACTPGATQPRPPIDRKCSIGLVCAGDPPTCESAPAAGEPCGPGAACASGAECASVNGTCVALPDPGAPCLDRALGPARGLVCNDGAFCDDQAGVCTTLKSDGVACSSFRECASTKCASPKGAVCGDASCVSVCLSSGLADSVICGAAPFSFN